VALETSRRNRRRSSDNLAQEIVQRCEDLPGFGVVAPLLLVHFFLVAAGTVLGGDDHVNQCPVVLEGIRDALCGPMAVEAIDPLLPVRPQPPFLD
jgi:hypothetical protein